MFPILRNSASVFIAVLVVSNNANKFNKLTNYVYNFDVTSSEIDTTLVIDDYFRKRVSNILLRKNIYGHKKVEGKKHGNQYVIIARNIVVMATNCVHVVHVLYSFTDTSYVFLFCLKFTFLLVYSIFSRAQVCSFTFDAIKILCIDTNNMRFMSK